MSHLGFRSLNTYGMLRWTMPTPKHFRINRSSYSSQSEETLSVRAPSRRIFLPIPWKILNQLESILCQNENMMINLRVFVDYFKNILKFEYFDLPTQIDAITQQLESLVQLKGERYYCKWSNMLDLVEEYTSLQLIRTKPEQTIPLHIENIQSNSILSPPIKQQNYQQDTYFQQQYNIIKSKYDIETQKCLSKLSPIDRNVEERIENAIRNNGYGNKNIYKPWDINDTEEIIQELIESRKVPLTNEENRLVDNILNGPRTDEIMISKFNYEMTRANLHCLRPSTWLNDQVINYYMQLLQQRDQQLKEIYPNRKLSHFFLSFFMDKLIIDNNGYTYNNVKRWTKKCDIFSLDKVFVPINISNTHWTLAVIFMQKKEIHYYDSMSGAGQIYMDSLARWIVDEGKEKKGLIINPNEYKKISRHPGTPQQQNGVDCGVFTIICADNIFDNLPINESSYSQREMPFYRRRIVADIMRGELLYPMKVVESDYNQ